MLVAYPALQNYNHGVLARKLYELADMLQVCWGVVTPCTVVWYNGRQQAGHAVPSTLSSSRGRSVSTCGLLPACVCSIACLILVQVAPCNPSLSDMQHHYNHRRSERHHTTSLSAQPDT
jgi:hypothetical protein